MLIHAIILIISILILVKSADWFIDNASAIAQHFGISDLIIGLTLVAVGTSLPELASSIAAALSGNADIAIGNVLGSNVANILLVLGIASFFATLPTSKELLDRDGIMLVFASVFFYWILVLTRFDYFISNYTFIRFLCVLMILLFFAYLFYLTRSDKHYSKSKNFESFIIYFLNAKFIKDLFILARHKNVTKEHKKEYNEHLVNKDFKKLLLKFVFLIISCVGIIISAKFFITEAMFFANWFGVSGGVIGLTLVALGTSLPEIPVSVIAAKKGLGGIAIGNIMGSNIANILFVGGVSLFISPAILPRATLMYTFPFTVIISVLLLYFIKTRWKIRWTEGFIFLLLYVVFLGLIYQGIII